MARASQINSPPAASPKEAPRCIRLHNVRQNNLKGFDLELPLGKLIVVTGLSGSGKSSLAFETIYAEGQRRYIETFTPYARQFFDRMDKPAVDRIENIPPAIAIEQRNAVRSSRSTVGTMTEICDYMKVVWPHWATLHCRQCARPVRREPPQAVWEQTLAEGPQSGGPSECLITFDLPMTDKLEVAEQLQLLGQQGFRRLWVDGTVVRLEEASTALPPRMPHLTVVADRIRLQPDNRSRFVEACEQAYHFGRSRLTIRSVDPSTRPPRNFSSGFHCATCDLAYPEPTPALFSFNNPVGACPACKGFGRIITIDPDLALPDRSKTLAEGVVKPWQSGMSAECQADLLRMARKRGVPAHVPFRDLSPEHQRWVMDGDPGHDPDVPEHSWPHSWYGVKGYFRWLESKAYKMHVRVLLSRYRSYRSCPDCGGRRFNADSLQYRLGPKATPGVQPTQLTLADFYTLPIRDALARVDDLVRLRGSANDPISMALTEVRTRLGYLDEVGLGYLTLDRATRTLSGGETERVNLTTCLGSRLTHALFVLDEPSVGLHPRDTDRLIRILLRLRDVGNTVVVVEHESSVMRAADLLVDLGPGHGEGGGRLVFRGTPRELTQSTGSLTAEYLTGRRQIQVPRRRTVGPSNASGEWVEGVGFAAEPAASYKASPRVASLRQLSSRLRTGTELLATSTSSAPTGNSPAGWLRLRGATAHNLKNLSAEIPLGRLVCLTGVSGSGKTTLVREVLLPLLQQKLSGRDDASAAALEEEVDGEFRGEALANLASASLTGAEPLGSVVLVDQSPIGRTPRSNPAVYIGAFDDIREVFATSPAARERGLTAGAFSFNSAQGQCERCRGAGFEKIEMQFLSDVFVRCPVCQGRRYQEHILEVKLGRPRSLADSAIVQGLPAISIADLLEAPVEEVRDFLAAMPDSRPARRAASNLNLLCDVGLGYLRVGQPVNTLSGGESQRLKLVSHLAGSAAAIGGAGNGGSDERTMPARRTLFLFDEPTTGLHFDDVRVLLAVFQRLVSSGHSVLVIEHNLDVIKSADWILDLGPEAGTDGGELVVAGTPETVASCARSHTGAFLKAIGIRDRASVL